MPPVALVHSRDTGVPRASKTAAEGTVVPESSDTAFQVLDRAARAAISQATFGISPAALGGAFFDWWVHLAFSPGKQAELAQQAIAGAADNLAFAAQSASGSPGDPSERALPHDNRFRAPDWRVFPFNVYAHNFLSIERWWAAATTHVRGVSQGHDDMANFTARQLLDTVAPSNFIGTNPEALARTSAKSGANLVRGYANWIADLTRARSGALSHGTEAFKVGETVAVTPGKVVLSTWPVRMSPTSLPSWTGSRGRLKALCYHRGSMPSVRARCERGEFQLYTTRKLCTWRTGTHRGEYYACTAAFRSLTLQRSLLAIL